MKTDEATIELPRLQKRGRGIYGGRVEILLSESQTWEQAQSFAGDLVTRLGLVVTKRIDGPDAWIWDVRCGQVELVMGYDDYPCETTLGCVDAAGDPVIHALFRLLKAEP